MEMRLPDDYIFPQDIVVTCVTATPDFVPVNNSVLSTCCRCGDRVWVGPRVAATARRHIGEAHYHKLCIDCAAIVELVERQMELHSLN